MIQNPAIERDVSVAWCEISRYLFKINYFSDALAYLEKSLKTINKH